MTVYHLRVRVEESRKPTASALLFSLAQQLLRAERAGESVEQVHCHLTADGDYSAIAFVYPADIENAGPTQGRTTEASDMAEDDITVADEVKNGEQRESDEAARLQRIEEFKQRDAERWRK